MGGFIGGEVVGFTVAVGRPSSTILGLLDAVGEVVGLAVGARVANMSSVGKSVTFSTGDLVPRVVGLAEVGLVVGAWKGEFVATLGIYDVVLVGDAESIAASFDSDSSDDTIAFAPCVDASFALMLMGTRCL